MDKVTVRYARFLAPGSFVANEWTRPVDTLAPEAVAWPENAYAFTLHERVDVLDGTDTFTGNPQQVGPMYYHPDSKVLTQADVAAKNDPRDSTLLSNMRCNEWDTVIYSRWGNWPQPFDAGKAQILGAA